MSGGLLRGNRRVRLASYAPRGSFNGGRLESSGGLRAPLKSASLFLFFNPALNSADDALAQSDEGFDKDKGGNLHR